MPTPGASSRSVLPRHAPALAGLVVVLAGLAAYCNSFAGAFVFDDIPSIPENPTLQPFQPLGQAWTPPPGGLTVSGRPLVNFTLALNHALGGNSPGGYHAFNLAVHLLAGLTLFGLLRRTFQRPRLAARFGTDGTALALIVALLWVVHPLQTESVTYIVQRAESLAGLFYLLTLYFFLRGAESSSTRWFGGAIAACLLGMATKETMATAPLVVLLYDRTFVGGSFRAAWRQRGRWHLALGLTWLLLGWLVWRNAGRGESAGLHGAVTMGGYALEQLRAVPHYLRLVFWPHPLVFDYGEVVAVSSLQAATGALVIGLLVGATAVALWRRPALGLAGAAFCLALAPSSSVVPVATQAMAEHRMYLPLAVVLGATILVLYGGIGRAGLWLGSAAAVGCLLLTVQRNRAYDSGYTLWRQTAQDCPENPRAHLNLGYALAAQGRLPGAIAEYQQALGLKPDYADAHYDWANALVDLGRPAEATEHFAAALRLKPDMAEAHYNWANALAHLGQRAEAAAHYEAALNLKPDYPKAHYNLGNTLVDLGRLPEAISHYTAAVRLAPAYTDALVNLGNALMQSGHPAEAIAQYQAALALDPASADTHNNLGTALLQSGRVREAIAEYERALQLKPGYAEAAQNLALARQARK